MPRQDVDRGRRAYDRRAWADAHRLLSLADRENALGAHDLERLATAAFLIGRGGEFERALERAHQAYRDAGDRARAARCAFWIGFRRFLHGETGPATGWFARGRRLLDQKGRETAEEGYLLLPVASPSQARYFSPIEEMVPGPWVKGHVVLIGDAAHAVSPNMAPRWPWKTPWSLRRSSRRDSR